jgi:hypothetical protein
MGKCQPHHFRIFTNSELNRVQIKVSVICRNPSVLMCHVHKSLESSSLENKFKISTTWVSSKIGANDPSPTWRWSNMFVSSGHSRTHGHTDTHACAHMLNLDNQNVDLTILLMFPKSRWFPKAHQLEKL